MKLSSIPQGDGTEKACLRYLSKIKAMSQYQDGGDACDKLKMRACPTKAEYEALVQASTVVDVIAKIKLWKSNAKLMATIVMGQQSNHGMAMVEKTKSADLPSGQAWKVLEAMQKKCKQSNATSEIQMEQDVDNLRFGSARQFYNGVIGVTAQYNVTMTVTMLIKKMAKKVIDPVCVRSML